MPKLREPSLKQQKFIDAYLETGNATEAAIAAGYKCRSRAVAQTIGSENLLNPMIAARLAKRRAELSQKTDITVERLQSNLFGVAQKAEAEGKYSAAVAAYSALLKSVGGFVADKQPPENLAGKALDAKRAEEMRLAIELVYSRRYLADAAVRDVESRIALATECPIDAPRQPTYDEQHQDGQITGWGRHGGRERLSAGQPRLPPRHRRPK